MPLMFAVMFAFFPAGLVLYWTVNGGLSLLQQWVITQAPAERRQQGQDLTRGASRATLPDAHGAADRHDRRRRHRVRRGRRSACCASRDRKPRQSAQALTGKRLRRAFSTLPRFAMPTAQSSIAAWSCLFAAPRSYTGEDVLELHAHGSPVVLTCCSRACSNSVRARRVPANSPNARFSTASSTWSRPKPSPT